MGTKGDGIWVAGAGAAILLALLLFGSRPAAMAQGRAAGPRVPTPLNASQYRTLAVPPNPANPPGPAQPIPFSHKLHLALNMQCSTCHENPGNGALMTLPTAQTCMSCHKTVARATPAIEKLAAYAKSGKAIPWVPVYVLLKGVNFSHKTHIAAQVQCETCHGPVSDMAVMREATSVTSMGVCMRCHKMNNAPNSCVTCHAAWGPGMTVVKHSDPGQ